MSGKLVNLEAEEAVLGALLLDPSALTEVPFLQSEDFYGAFNQRIYECIQALAREAKPVDLVSVAGWLERNGTLQQIGGRMQLSALLERAVTSVDVRYHAEVCRKLSGARHASRLLSEAVVKVEEAEDPEAVLNLTAEEWFRRFGDDKAGALPAYDIARRQTEQLVKARERGFIGVSTGFSALDEMNILMPGEVTGFTAWKAGGGKSSIVGQILRHVSETSGPALLVSAELSEWTIFLREVSARSKVRVKEILKGETSLFAEGINQFANSNIWIDASGMPSVDSIRSQALKVRRKAGGLSIIVIDMLQHIEGRGHGEWEQIGNTMKDLKRLAKALDIPVVIVSSVNRRETDNGLPTLKNLYGGQWIDSICASALCIVSAPLYFQKYADRHATDGDRGKRIMPDWATFWRLEGWGNVPEKSVVLMAENFKTRHGAPRDIPLSANYATYTFSEIETYAQSQARTSGERFE